MLIALIRVLTYNENLKEYHVESVKELREIMRGKPVYVSVFGRDDAFHMDAKKAEVVAMFEWFKCDSDEGEIMCADVYDDSVYVYFE